MRFQYSIQDYSQSEHAKPNSMNLQDLFTQLESTEDVAEIGWSSEIVFKDENRDPRSLQTVAPKDVGSIEFEPGFLLVWYENHVGRVFVFNFNRPSALAEHLTRIDPPFLTRYCDGIYLFDAEGPVEFQLRCKDHWGRQLKFDPTEFEINFSEVCDSKSGELVWKYAR